MNDQPETVTKYRCRTCGETFDKEHDARLHARNHESKPYQKISAPRTTQSLVQEIEVEPQPETSEPGLAAWTDDGDDET